MRKLTIVFLMFVALFVIATPVFAQEAAPATTHYDNWFLAAIGIGIAVGLAGLGQAKVAASVAESLARNPAARPGIQLALFIGLAFIESLVLFAWVLLFIKAK
jgi:F-type H+-transporting ATPase subunit c